MIINIVKLKMSHENASAYYTTRNLQNNVYT